METNNDNGDFIYFIAYPGGDRTKITVCYESIDDINVIREIKLKSLLC